MNIELMRAIAHTVGKVARGHAGESDPEEWLSCLGELLATDDASEGHDSGIEDAGDCPAIREQAGQDHDDLHPEIAVIPGDAWTPDARTPGVASPPEEGVEVEIQLESAPRASLSRGHGEGTDGTEHRVERGRMINQAGTAAAPATPESGREGKPGETMTHPMVEDPPPSTQSGKVELRTGISDKEVLPIAFEVSGLRDEPGRRVPGEAQPSDSYELEVRPRARPTVEVGREGADFPRHPEMGASPEALSSPIRGTASEVRGSPEIREMSPSFVAPAENAGTRESDGGTVTIRMDAEDSAPITVRMRTAGEQLVGSLRSPDPALVREMGAGARELERNLGDSGFESVDFAFETGDLHRHGSQPNHRQNSRGSARPFTYPSVAAPEPTASGAHRLGMGLDLLA